MAESSTILVVEDDPVILDLLAVNFELEGYTVVRAVDGEDGLAPGPPDPARRRRHRHHDAEAQRPRPAARPAGRPRPGLGAGDPAVGQGPRLRRPRRASPPVPTTT